MRFLLISDTHGKLGIINELAVQTHADAVIHAGDFGFYDHGSHERLSNRDLRLNIIHSDLSADDKDRILSFSRDEQVQALRRYCLLGEFPAYLDVDKSFHVPVYAVWGNHEDKEVVELLCRGDLSVRNLHVLDHGHAYRVGPAFIYGLGGNFLPGSKLLQKPIAGGGGKIWSTLSQYIDLAKIADEQKDQSTVRLFVSHVSPGKEPFVEFIGARTQADFTISGHMGAPMCMVWNPFAISSEEESQKRLEDGLESVKRIYANATSPGVDSAEQAFSFLAQLPNETVNVGRRAQSPLWYRKMTHINLPDADVGYAVIDVEKGHTQLNTFVITTAE